MKLFCSLYYRNVWIGTLVLFGMAVAERQNLVAAERWNDFYAALIQNGYPDVAVDYVESLRGKPTAPPEFLEEADYLLGKGMIEILQSVPGADRAACLEKCRAHLDRFLAEHPNHADACAAGGLLGGLYAEDGRNKLAGITPELSDAEQLRIRLAARKDFSTAKTFIDRALELAQKKAKSIRADEVSNGSPDAMKAYGDYLDLLLESTRLEAEIAETAPRNSADWKNGLVAAKKKFNEIYQKYGNYPGGYIARYHEARIADLLGQTDEAQLVLGEIGMLPMQKALFGVKTDALRLASQITLRERNPESLMQLLRSFNIWKEAGFSATPPPSSGKNAAAVGRGTIPVDYYSRSDSLEIHLAAARAALALFDLKTTNPQAFKAAGNAIFTDKSDPAMKLFLRLDDFAFETLDFVYRQKNRLSLEAEKLLKNPPLAEKMIGRITEKPTDFAGAVTQVNRTWTNFVQANLEASEAVGADAMNSALARKNDTAAEADFAFRQAFAIAGRKTDPAALDDLRLRWATLALLTGRNEDAEILADFLLFRRESFLHGTKAAELGLFAVKNRFFDAQKSNAPEAELSELQRRIAEKTDFIIKRWGDGFAGKSLPVVQDAVMVQMETAVGSGNIAAARAFLDRIPANSSQRADAEIELGQSLWAEHLKRLAAGVEEDFEGDSDADSDAPLGGTLVDMAESVLEKGLRAKLGAGNPRSDDYPILYAVLTLTQVKMAQQKPDDAFDWLTHPVIGPLTIAEKRIVPGNVAGDENGPNDVEADTGSPSVNRRGLTDSFFLATLTVSLRVLVAKQDFDRAGGVMARLETLIDRFGAGNQDRLTGIYLQLGRELEDQIRPLRDAAARDPSKGTELKNVTAGFERFLDRISQRHEGNSYAALRWVADTYYRFGLGVSGADGALTPEAKAYFEKSGRLALAMLTRIAAEPDWAPNETANIATTIRLAECLGRVGKTEAAIEYLLPLLKSNENNLDLQTAAAGIYQTGGTFNKEHYIRAIAGARPATDGKNLVWGWNRIITILGRNLVKGEPYTTRFYDAVLNKTECRKRWIESLPSADDRKKQSQNGESELLRLYQVHPDLGGDATYKKLENYLIDFRRTAGNLTPDGFSPSKSPSTK